MCAHAIAPYRGGGTTGNVERGVAGGIAGAVLRDMLGGNRQRSRPVRAQAAARTGPGPHVIAIRTIAHPS